MNATTQGAWGYGLATLSDPGGRVLDTWYPGAATRRRRRAHAPRRRLAGADGRDERRGVRTAVVLTGLASLADPPADPHDAYLRLHLLSHRLVRPHEVNLNGVFGVLNNVAWTSHGPVDPAALAEVRMRFRAAGEPFAVTSIDKFPRMSDYVVPAGVRIADADRVRLGAHLAAGTTVMHEGFVNFNAGTLGSSMVEGRISAGVVVGDGSDIGGGASIMGTLSGGGTQVISIGERCLLGANAGLGISLGDDCVVEAGLYVTAGSRVTTPDGEVVKAGDAQRRRRPAVPPQLAVRRDRGAAPERQLGRAERRPPRERIGRRPSRGARAQLPSAGATSTRPTARLSPAPRPRGLAGPQAGHLDVRAGGPADGRQPGDDPAARAPGRQSGAETRAAGPDADRLCRRPRLHRRLLRGRTGGARPRGQGEDAGDHQLQQVQGAQGPAVDRRGGVRGDLHADRRRDPRRQAGHRRRHRRSVRRADVAAREGARPVRDPRDVGGRGTGEGTERQDQGQGREGLRPRQAGRGRGQGRGRRRHRGGQAARGGQRRRGRGQGTGTDAEQPHRASGARPGSSRGFRRRRSRTASSKPSGRAPITASSRRSSPRSSARSRRSTPRRS